MSRKKKDLPYMPFYIGDHIKDPGVNSLPREERYMWLELCWLMWESEERGYLKFNGRPMSEEGIANALHLDKANARRILAKFEEANLFSRTGEGVIYSRKIVAIVQLSETRSKSGGEGGNPKLGVNYNHAGFIYAMQRSEDGAVKIGISKDPNKMKYKISLKFPTQSITLLATKYVQDMGAEEDFLHKKFSDFKNGEWFNLGEEQLNLLIVHLKAKNVSPLGSPLAILENENDNEFNISSPSLLIGNVEKFLLAPENELTFNAICASCFLSVETVKAELKKYMLYVGKSENPNPTRRQAIYGFAFWLSNYNQFNGKSNNSGQGPASVTGTGGRKSYANKIQ